ncbi:hypothetical protein FRC17_002114 [Serendipita sp. 399]|nr:hypothetical protein FRC17_002114 [Serendipita sp. 399]
MYEPPQDARYDRPGTGTGRYQDFSSRVVKSPLSPIVRSKSIDGRARDGPSAPGGVAPHPIARRNGASHIATALRQVVLAPKASRLANVVNISSEEQLISQAGSRSIDPPSPIHAAKPVDNMGAVPSTTPGGGQNGLYMKSGLVNLLKRHQKRAGTPADGPLVDRPGLTSRLPPPPLDASKYLKSELPPTPSSAASINRSPPRPPTVTRQMQQASSTSNGSNHGPPYIPLQTRSVTNPRGMYPGKVAERVISPPLNSAVPTPPNDGRARGELSNAGVPTITNTRQKEASHITAVAHSQLPISNQQNSLTPMKLETEIDDEGEVPDLSGSVVRGRHPIFTGTYSSVYKGIWDDHPVAVKVIRTAGSLIATRRKFKRESKVWSRLSHPNILPLYGICMEDDFGPFGALISPWCKNGTSAQRIYNIAEPTRRISLLLGVANGVRYLHEHKSILVHGDLKPANILIDDDGEARLCDFGLVRYVQETGTGTTTTTAHTGTARYLARELVAPDSDPGADGLKPTTKSDCHALGCIALEFAYRRPPYADRNSSAPAGYIYADIIKGIPPCPSPDTVQDHLGHIRLWTLFEACWNVDPQQRPSSTQVYNYLLEHEATIVEALTSGIDIF